ncbi:MAG: FIST N-terminal domain-containing protein, partial [bacterium]
MPDDDAEIRMVCGLSDLMDSTAAVAECLERLHAGLAGRVPDALFLFVSPHHRDAYALIQESLIDAFKPGLLVGCSGGGVIGGARELEELPGLSVTAAIFPGVRLSVRHLRDEDLPGPDEAPRAWELALGARAEDRPSFIAFLSPFMSRAEELLAGMDYAFPQCRKIGGVASGLRHLE